MQCKAKAKSTQKQCRRSAVAGKEVCTVHGGLSLGGIASATFETGRYSKYIPTRLAARYNESQQDGALLGLRAEVSLVDARLADLLERVDSGESSSAWQAVKRAYDDFDKAVATGDAVKRMNAFNALGTTITQGMADYAAWHEIGEQIEQRRKLVESERKHMEQMGQMITLQQSMLLVGQLTDVLSRHVTDRATLGAIGQDFNRILTRE